MARADRVFALIVVLAVSSSAVLLALLASLIAPIGRIAQHGVRDAAEVVPVVVLILAIVGIVFGFASLARQLLATWALIRALVARRVATPPIVERIAAELGLADRVDVVRDRRQFSFCYWFLRPRICLSTAIVDALDDDELRAVVLHERYHLKQRDPLRLVVARYFAAGLYVVPVVDELVAYHTLQKELAADAEAVRAVGDVRPLARALYKVVSAGDEVTLGLLAPVGLSATEARIEQLMSGSAVPLTLSPASLALSGGTLLGAIVLAAALTGTDVAAAPLLVGLPATLLFAAAVSGAMHQVRAASR